jgi:hypothetical protein
LSINHDKPGIPWTYNLPHTDCMEVWQSSWLTSNWVSRDRYQQRLASGRRISAIGGSDFHQPERLVQVRLRSQDPQRSFGSTNFQKTPCSQP